MSQFMSISMAHRHCSKIRFKERGVARRLRRIVYGAHSALALAHRKASDDGTYTRAGNGVWELWEDRGEGSGDSHKDDWQMIDNGVFPDVFTELPVAIFNANPNLENPQKCDGPVLIDHANLNIKHWQRERSRKRVAHLFADCLYGEHCAKLMTTK